MGILDAPAVSPLTFARLNQARGLTVVSSKSMPSGTAKVANSQTTRMYEVMPTDVLGIAAAFINWYVAGGGENTFPGWIQVRAELQLRQAGSANLNESNSASPSIPLTFGGRGSVWIRPGRMVLSDIAPVHVAAGTQYHVKTYVLAASMPAPPAPTLATATSGGAISAGTYKVVLTYVYPDGVESLASASASQVTTGAASTITVTSPAAVAGAIGYRVYAAATALASQYSTDSGAVPFGTDYVWKQNVNALVLPWRDVAVAGAAASFPTGVGFAGGTANANVDNGEGFLDAADRLGEGVAISQNITSSGYGPAAVLGLTPDRVLPSLGLMGDSIMAGTADYGFIGLANGGGFGVRAALGQAGARGFDTAVVPPLGHISSGVGGDKGSAFATAGGLRRTGLLSMCTTILCNYGTNDLGTPDPASTIASNLLTIAARFTGQRRKFLQTTILPKPTSTDGWRTIANQSLASATQEGHRRQLNSWILKTGAQSTVTNEAMLGGYAGAQSPAVNLYGGGNAAATVFLTRQMFVQGSEVVKVAGVTKVLTTDYTYLGALTIGGVAYACGVTFLSAPSAAATVTAGYTAAAGFRSLGGTLVDFVDTAAAVEVDAGGVAGTNGGWWLPDVTAVRDSGTPTAVASTSLTDSSKAWAVNQHRGYTMRIVTDTTTPTAVGQVRGIAYNTATVLTTSSAWTVTPSTAATYEIADAVTMDGTHPTTRGHMLLAAAVDLTKVA